MNRNYCILKERGIDFVLPAWIEPAYFQMWKMQLEHGVDLRFDSDAQMVYDRPAQVARIVFDLGAQMLESYVNK